MTLPATAQCPSNLDYYWPLRSAQGSGTVAHGYAADAALSEKPLDHYGF